MTLPHTSGWGCASICIACIKSNALPCNDYHASVTFKYARHVKSARLLVYVHVLHKKLTEVSLSCISAIHTTHLAQVQCVTHLSVCTLHV